jgi:hypothetical protein
MFWVVGAFADAGNPVLGTIKGDIVDTSGNPNDADTRVTVYVRGQWNWLSHNKDCNVDRNGTGVGIIWNDPTEPGYTVAKGSISAGVGIAFLRAGDTDNTIDRMVHPSDRGNIPESQPGPAGQQFVDPSPPNPSSYLAWRSGCGRVPITTVCAGDAVGDPCGSWGYEKTDGIGTGYRHTYAKRSDVRSVCVNFYDVHGSDAGFEGPNGAKEITVNGNGDNSIQTNSFDVHQGANCIFFPTLVTVTQKNGVDFTSGTALPTDDIRDKAVLTGAPPGAGTLTFQAFKNDATCTSTAARVLNQSLSVPGNGTYFSNTLTKPVSEGTYYWLVSYTSAGGATGSAACGDLSGGSHERIDVQKQPTSTYTGQKLTVKDKAVINGFAQGGSGATVRFRLFDNAQCSGNPIYDSGNLALDYSTGSVTSGDVSVQNQSTSDKTFYWLVNFSGDQINAASTSACGDENFTIHPDGSGTDP